jgi:hypothetical protein
MAYLKGLELHKREKDSKWLTMRRDPLLFAVVWMDCDLHSYFIASASSLQEGAFYNRLRWRKLEQGVLIETVELEVPQPLASEIYNETCARINQSNLTLTSHFEIEAQVQGAQLEQQSQSLYLEHGYC